MNSFGFRSVSPAHHRTWSPDIALEERFRKKRAREDDYIRTIDPEHRPILMINKKQEFKGLVKPTDAAGAPNDDFYKVSKNTALVPDVELELKKREPMIKKKTVLHLHQQEAPKEETLTEQDLENTLYKIEGIEFLPEGFLELDPLLFKDDFQFDSRYDVKLFEEEQKRLKALRRKQYEQRNYQKMRDVTIYVADEQNNKIVDFLERWYF